MIRSLTVGTSSAATTETTMAATRTLATVAALLDLGMIDPEDFEVDVWHATDPGGAEAIIAEQLLRCDANGVAYLSSSPNIAGLLSATGARRGVLLRLRVPLAVLDISKDWRPGDARVDFNFLCGSFFAGAVTVVERRDL